MSTQAEEKESTPVDELSLSELRVLITDRQRRLLGRISDLEFQIAKLRAQQILLRGELLEVAPAYAKEWWGDAASFATDLAE